VLLTVAFYTSLYHVYLNFAPVKPCVLSTGISSQMFRVCSCARVLVENTSVSELVKSEKGRCHPVGFPSIHV
jgi:hypothetical protein